MRGSAAWTALGLGVALALSGSPARAHGEETAAVFILVIGGASIASTTYDVVQIAGNEHASLVWTVPQAGLFTILTGSVGAFIVTDQRYGRGPGFLGVEGWFAALSGYSIGSIVSERPRSALVGATLGLTAVSYQQMTLTLVGNRADASTSIAQAALATPAILGGSMWAIDATSSGSRTAAIGLASAGGIAFVHGVAASIVESARAPESRHDDANAPYIPNLVATPVRGGWELSMFGAW